jgi:type IV pilus assembly protein PilB
MEHGSDKGTKTARPPFGDETDSSEQISTPPPPGAGDVSVPSNGEAWSFTPSAPPAGYVPVEQVPVEQAPEQTLEQGPEQAWQPEPEPEPEPVPEPEPELEPEPLPEPEAFAPAPVEPSGLDTNWQPPPAPEAEPEESTGGHFKPPPVPEDLREPGIQDFASTEAQPRPPFEPEPELEPEPEPYKIVAEERFEPQPPLETDRPVEADPPLDLQPFDQSQPEEVADDPDRITGLTAPTRRGGSGRFITDHIVELGFATIEEVEAATEEGRKTGIAPEEVLLHANRITQDQLARATAERFGLDHLDLSLFDIDLGAVNLIPLQAARRFEAVPVAFVSEGTVLVAMTDPTNVRAVDDISIMTGLDVRPAVASAEDVTSVMARISKLDTAVADAIEEGEDEEEGHTPQPGETIDNAPVVKLVNGIVAQGVDEKASDIHFEPQGRELRVRYRVDGMLHDVTTIPRRMVPGVTSRLKIMGNLDIAERRLPQDGRISVVVEDRPIDIRVASLPAVHGEKIVLRLLDKDKALITLDQLGMAPNTLESFRKGFTRAYGATLVTGPTGSGKTTSLYAALNIVNTPEKNIITIEDPVEYQLRGITQVQTNVKTGLTFAAGLRSIVRSDPDVIMIGEIRDRETAQIAVESALTGHLVLSTLHTNDAPSAMTRLTEMDIEPFLTASAIDCVVSQRLARLLCSSCKEPVTISAEQLRNSNLGIAEDMQAYEARGCPRCAHTGYKGRVGLYEAMVVSDEIRSLVIERAPADSIRNVAIEQGMQTLGEDGVAKVRAGLTTVEEVARVTGSAISAD